MTHSGRRMFFALWPDPALSAVIERQLRNMQPSGRWVPASKRHLTLHFLGNMSDSERDCMLAAATAIQVNGFSILFDHFRFVKRSSMLWLCSESTPPELVNLVDKLGNALATCGIAVETRRFTPHITLVRKCAKPRMMDSTPMPVWCVNGFSLVESIARQGGFHYEITRHWDLGIQKT